MKRITIIALLIIAPIINKASDTLTLYQFQDIVKIPTKYPVDFSLGYENNSGEFLNGDNDVPTNGLLYGTISVSVLRGLLFDEQRFSITGSELLADKSKIEKELIVRDVIIKSLHTYVEWSTAYNELEITNEYLSRVTERHSLVKQLFENGDKPAIDTIESRINLNTATKTKIKAAENLLRKRQKINLLLWGASNEPIQLLESVVPQNISTVMELLQYETIAISQNWNNDPTIRKKQISIDQINLNNRLEREQLKPQLDLKLNTIHSLGDADLAYSYNVNDYKLGASLLIPLRNRKTKGQIRLNEALITQNRLDQNYYINELGNRYEMLTNAIALRQQSLDISLEKLDNSNLLYTAEQLKFELGESSVFLLNSRERKLLEAETEYIKSLKLLSANYTELYFLKLGQENGIDNRNR